MNKLILAIALILFPLTLQADESTYRVNNNIRTLTATYIKVPEVVRNADTRIYITAYPNRGYYKAEIVLLKPYGRICGLHKTLEVWDNEKIVKSTVNVDIGIRCRFIKRIAERIVEKVILEKEKEYLQGL
jgi:hypothetical protein